MLKKSVLISVLALALLGWCLPVMAEESATDQSGNIVPFSGTKAPGDILWHCDVQSLPVDNLILGIETFHDTIYITGGGNLPHENPNKVHVWTTPGGVCTYLYSVNQPTTPAGWGWRDIACDGQYLYASDSYVLAAFTVSPAGVTVNGPASITVNSGQMPSLNPVRSVAYDEDHDWFWAVNFGNPIYAFDRTGNMVAGPYTNTYSAYGLAYDNDSPGGPFLWVHVQDSCNVYQFDPSTGTYTGISYSGWGDDDPGVSGIAGGLCVLEGDESKEKAGVTLLGIMQGSPTDEMYAMEILVQEDSLYWKPPYENYAPSGMPDISQFQEWWYKIPTGEHTFCGPCAVANCFMWFDAKYEEGFGGGPGDGMDQFPLVRQYIDAIGGLMGPWDDHDPFNVEHIAATPWLGPATPPPPPTVPQPFFPGPQPPGMPPWGELVERLAWFFDTDGVRFGYCSHLGTQPTQMYFGIQDWFNSEMFEDGSNLMDTFCVNLRQMPTFAEVESLVEKCEDVILLLGFWWNAGGGEQMFIRGDVNADGVVNDVDIDLCAQGGPFVCYDAADANDDGVVDPSDCAYIFNWMFQSGPPPPHPFPDCGVDETADGIDCASFPPCPGAGWFRCGGHYVTVAGVNSEEYLIALSDPYYDNAELGGRGRVLDGFIIPHTPGHTPDNHNDVGNVSHDIYNVIPDAVSPGGLWELADYPLVERPWYCDDWTGQNVPLEFEDVTMPWPGGEVPVFVEVEYAIQISPWDYRGDVAPTGGNGVTDVGDAVYILNYLFKGGDAPDPFIEADTNCDGLVNLSDAILILNYLFKGGDILRCCDP